MGEGESQTTVALLCGPPSAERDAVRSALEASSDFELADVVDTAAATIEACSKIHPDVLVVDEALPGANAEQLVRKFAVQRPLPTLLLVSGDAAGPLETDELLRRLRIYKLSKNKVGSQPGADQSALHDVLRTLRARTVEPRRTITRGRIASIVDDLLDEEQQQAASDTARRIIEEPLELIVLAGGEGGAEALRGVLAEVTELRVPVVVGLDESADAWSQLERSASRLRVNRLDMSLRVRWSTGIFVAFEDTSVAVRGEVVDITNRGRLDIGQLFASMAVLGTAGLSVLLSPTTSDAATGLLAAARRGGHTARLHAEADDGIRATRLSSSELAWALSNAVPKRV